jgi:hypothetical protein
MRKLFLKIILASAFIFSSANEIKAASFFSFQWVKHILHPKPEAANVMPVSKKAKFKKSKAHPGKNEARYDKEGVPFG